MNKRFGYSMALALLRAGKTVQRDAWNGLSKHLDRLKPGESQTRLVIDGISAPWTPSPADQNAHDWHIRTEEDT